jgi:hypothetical protein
VRVTRRLFENFAAISGPSGNGGERPFPTPLPHPPVQGRSTPALIYPRSKKHMLTSERVVSAPGETASLEAAGAGLQAKGRQLPIS